MAHRRDIGSFISTSYLDAQRTLHERPDYGIASLFWGAHVAGLIGDLKATRLLDYGSGKGRLVDGMSEYLEWPVTVQCYDPAIPDYSHEPEPAELVVCLDVLEHIEPVHLNAVLDDLKRCTLDTGFFTVATGPAVKTLPDGRNAHLIQEGIEYWLPRIWKRFRIVEYRDMDSHFTVTVRKGLN